VENPYCVATLLNAVGENEDVILVTTDIFQTFLRQNALALVSSPDPATVINCVDTAGAIPEYTYDQPVVTAPETIASALFPNGTSIKGVYLYGGITTFNPDTGRSIDGDGYPYGMAKIGIKFGAQKYTPNMVSYLQSKRWNILKMSGDQQTMFVYGGPSGMTANSDDPVVIQFAGNNENSGAAMFFLEQKKAGSALVYINIGSLASTPDNAIATLYEAFRTKTTMPQNLG
jgi:hypothetical protein